MKRILSFLCLASSLAATETRPHPPETQPHPPSFQPSRPPPKPEEVDLFNRNDQAFILNGEFIYWTVSEGALDYAIRMKRPAWGLPNNNNSISYAQGDMERAEFDWDPGYRFSAGYFRAPNFWEVLGQYTFIHFDGHDRLKRPPASEDRYLTGTFPHIFTAPLQGATSDIHLHYQLVNLITNRLFFPHDNPHLRIKLGGGITAVWINQDWRVNYFSAIQNSTTIINRWRYWGIGMRGGISFDWFWGYDIYLSGTFSTALVVGHYHNHAKQETSTPVITGDDPSVPVRDVRYKDYRMSFTHQFVLGPSYQKSFGSFRFEIFAGYEMTLWTNLQEVFRSTAGPADQAKETWINDGLVALHGLTTRLSLSF